MNNPNIPSTVGSNGRGLLIVNADDWGRDVLNTTKIFECSKLGTISCVSAMVFMEDSERAAALAKEHGIDAGLHLNFTTEFSGSRCAHQLIERQRQVAPFLRHRFGQILFHPGLVRSFEYLVAAQLDEYRRIYGVEPRRVDGHHHMHLSMNVLLQRLLPAATTVRRSFSFSRGEKSALNILYRRTIDRCLAKRHRLADFFFSLPPLEPASRLKRIYALGRQYVVELETHPVNADEYRYLTDGGILRQIGDIEIAKGGYDRSGK